MAVVAASEPMRGVQRVVRSRVTEPTMHEGVWTLSKFLYDVRIRVTRQYVEDAAFGLTELGVEFMNDERAAFDAWLDGMPPIQRYQQVMTPEFSQDDYLDIYQFRFTAKGAFALGNEAQMEKLLSRVDDAPLPGVRDVLLQEGAPMVIEDNIPAHMIRYEGQPDGSVIAVARPVEPERFYISQADDPNNWRIDDAPQGRLDPAVEVARIRALEERDRAERQRRRALRDGLSRPLDRHPGLDGWPTSLIDWDAAYRRLPRGR